MSPAARAQSCQLVSLGEVKIVGQTEMGANKWAKNTGAEVVAASLNGQPSLIGINLNFPYSLATRRRVVELNLPIGKPRLNLTSPGRDGISDLAKMGELQLGAAHLHGVEAFVDNAEVGHADILLSSLLLENFLPEFDIGHGILRLFSKEHCPDKVVYWAMEYQKLPFRHLGETGVFANVAVNGDKVLAAINPGIPRSVIPARYLETLSVPSQDNRAVLGTLEIGGVTLRNWTVSTDMPGSEATMLIGDDVLKHMRFIIDYDAKAIYFTVG
jgi:hypothetical protein